MRLFSGIFGCIFSFGFLFQASAVMAASLYIDPPLSTLYQGDATNYAIRLDVDESTQECVNAVDATIVFPENIEPVDVSIGNSIFSMWVEKPTINQDQRTITFAGGIPNGYCGRVTGDPELTNVIAELIFRSPVPNTALTSPENDTAQLSFAANSAAYLNDGFGTLAELTTYPAQITLVQSQGDTLLNSWQEAVDADTQPPERFSIFLEKQNTSGKYFVSFNTTDKQTGVASYQIMEEPLTQTGTFAWGRADAPWIEARSPYVLKDQSLNSTIRVKAIDKAGNEYIATLIPDESLRGTDTNSLMNVILIMFGVVLLFVVLAIVAFMVRKRKKTAVPAQETASWDAEYEDPTDLTSH